MDYALWMELKLQTDKAKRKMHTANAYTVGSGWNLILKDLGLRPTSILKRAKLPIDLLSRDQATLSTAEYFRLWESITEEANDPLLPIRLGEALSTEAFDPPIFAAMCSDNLNMALDRIAKYKRLICPMKLMVDVKSTGTTLELIWLERQLSPPAHLVAAELIFFVQLARIATRERICPKKVISPIPLKPVAEYSSFLGTCVRVKEQSHPTILFKKEDSLRPFLTANTQMWSFFEPSLQKNLSQLDSRSTMTERVQAALLELIPAGDASVAGVAKKLGISNRTLQRKLKGETTSFQTVLNNTREELARHYLKSSHLSSAEISFLLGFDDPNSFFRAFRSWTGTTTESCRSFSP